MPASKRCVCHHRLAIDHNIHTNEAKEFFAKMSAKYKDQPNIIYELFNEPDHETWSEVKNNMQKK